LANARPSSSAAVCVPSRPPSMPPPGPTIPRSEGFETMAALLRSVDHALATAGKLARYLSERACCVYDKRNTEMSAGAGLAEKDEPRNIRYLDIF